VELCLHSPTHIQGENRDSCAFHFCGINIRTEAMKLFYCERKTIRCIFNESAVVSARVRHVLEHKMSLRGRGVFVCSVSLLH